MQDHNYLQYYKSNLKHIQIVLKVMKNVQQLQMNIDINID